MFKQSAHVVEALINIQSNASKEKEREKKKLVRLMFHPIDKWNVRLGNALDVDLKIT